MVEASTPELHRSKPGIQASKILAAKKRKRLWMQIQELVLSLIHI